MLILKFQKKLSISTRETEFRQKRNFQPMIDALFIENNPSDVLLMQTFLQGSKSEKFNLVLANSIPVGLNLLRQRSFDVILLSLESSGTTGLNTVLTTFKEIKDIPIIVCASAKAEDMQAEILDSGANGYFVKSQTHVKQMIHQIKFVVETFRRAQRDYLMFTRNLF